MCAFFPGALKMPGANITVHCIETSAALLQSEDVAGGLVRPAQAARGCPTWRATFVQCGLGVELGPRKIMFTGN